ncbi:MAG: pyridoxamine 5'-phosphate oxidase [Elusimicrobia bacterium CG1_02_63_36]|nr:MAG: pyridoxamine 5'-phosphate oxidase [Elusimicrobia bacterium CG1_02_63_36]PJA18659.1 MAG: pyridoxamine 5'-phosphate oxidase [Elusimicrobia bacterium CG_4_10_14_0_2_um_filter_63_34]PJB23403.1 MAG: pyridoxamine 5'-phosphate oxidase [Elusimicrobia bacterium CG_4_9_14_3_um_filter_62_55]
MERLTDESLLADPIAQFDRWMKDAEEHAKQRVPESCCLSTLGADGYPDGRIVLLKFYDARGFVFYTNYRSPKGRALDAAPRAGLTFHWPALGRQVRVVGDVVKVSSEESDAYFSTRPRGSKISAWASEQSAPVEDRPALERKHAEMEAKFQDPVPRPPHWGGYRIFPIRIEFWQDCEFRLHDRFEFVRDGADWNCSRLSP